MARRKGTELEGRVGNLEEAVCRLGASVATVRDRLDGLEEERGDGDEVWTTRDGERLLVGEMDEDHVRNCLHMFVRWRRLRREARRAGAIVAARGAAADFEEWYDGDRRVVVTGEDVARVALGTYVGALRGHSALEQASASLLLSSPASHPSTYCGLSRQEASRRATLLCAVAAETGRWEHLASHLNALRAPR